MKIRYTLAAFALLAVLAGCGDDKTVKANEANGGSKGAPVTTAGQSDEGVLEGLKNDAYVYSGLAQEQKLTYEGQLSNLVSKDYGIQTVEWTENKNDASYFRVVRSGVLAGLGAEKIRLDDSGIYIVGISDGELVKEAYKMPSPFKIGTEWTTDFNLKTATGLIESQMTSKVVREETITAAGQEFKCLVVESSTTLVSEQFGTAEGHLTSVTYYAKGIGEVKLDATGTNPKGEDIEFHILLTKIGD